MTALLRISRRWLLLSGIIFLFLCFGGLAYLITSYPILGSTAVANPPINWTSLPSPAVIHPGFTSFTNAQKINALAQRDGFIWAASDGGLLVWSESDLSQVAQFSSEHGLGENRTSSLAVGLDGAIWVGTASAGVSRYDGVAWQTFTEADGLPANAIRDLAVSADGMVWAATSGGIGRYDGRRWFSYNRSRTLLQLPSNNVTSLALAADGLTLYAGTTEGVVRFNGRSWDSLAQIGSQAVNTVQHVAITPDGRVWAATQAGLSVYDGSGWQLFTTADGLASEDVRSVAANADGSVWLGYGEQGLGLTQVELSGGLPLITAVSPPNEQIFAILPSGSDLWLGSSTGVLRRAASGEWQTITPPSDIPSNSIVSLVVADGQPWLGGSEGVSRFDGSRWHAATVGLPDTAVTSLNRDSAGQLWATFSTVGQGATNYDFAADSWQPVRCPVGGPASPYVRHIVQTEDGLLWFATEAGLAVYDGRSQQWSLLNASDGLPSNVVQALALHPNGSLWVGTNAGLAVWEDGRFTTLIQDDVREMAVGPDGTVWYITADAVYRWRDVQAQNIVPPPVSQVYDVLATAEGFWLAAREGVAFFDGAQMENGRWLRFGSSGGLPGDRVTALSQATDGTVWASSELLPEDPALGSGLYGTYTVRHNYLSFFNGRSWQSTIRPAPVGLLHPVITSIVSTPDGSTWLSSLGGISRFDGQQWQQFSTLDGLPGYEVYQLLATDDSIWAVTSGGLAQFNLATQSWKSFTGIGNWPDLAAVPLAADASGTVWAGSGTELRRYDGRRWQSVPIALPDPAVEVRDFVAAADGRLWLIAHLDTPQQDQHLLAEVDGQTWQWHEVTLRAGGQFAPFSHLWLGPDGRLWASNDTSLWTFDLPAGNVSQPSQYPELIRAITDLTFLPDGTPVATTRFAISPLLLRPGGATPLEVPLEAANAFAIHAAPDGRLWLGTNQGAAHQLTDSSWQALPLTEAEIAQTVTELAAAQDGSLLLGTSSGGVLRWTGGQVSSLTSQTDSSEGSLISALLEAEGGTLWRASFGASVARTDGERWQLFPATPPIYALNVQEAAVSDAKTIWLATTDGLVSLTTVGERTVCQPAGVDYPDPAGLSADLLGRLWLVSERMIYRGNAAEFERMGTRALPVTAVAPDGAVWYVTETDLVRVQGNQRLPVAHNLPPETITALAIAPDGTVWLGTTEGAAVLQGGQWRTVTAADGLASNHVTHIAIAADGSVWLATTGGVSWIRP